MHHIRLCSETNTAKPFPNPRMETDLASARRIKRDELLI